MKINDIWIPVLVAILVFAIIVSNRLGIEIMPLLSYAILILLAVYLLIAARCCLIKAQDSKTSGDIDAKITMLNESLGRVEKKVDKIEKILEKVSE